MPNRPPDKDAPAFGKRLCKLLSDRDIPRRGAGAYLQRKYKVSNVTANDWLNGKFRPEIETARRIAEDHGATFEALYFGGVGSLTLAQVASRETPEAYVRFPLLEGFAGLGRGDYMGDYPEIVEFVEVTREWAGQKLRGVPLAEVRVITGRGDSMRGQYNDGDLIFMDNRVKRFVGDSAYCFRLHGQVQIKRLQMVGRNLVRVLSANAAYPPQDVALEEVEIGGRALAAWTLTEF